jgi:hypothetical protein
MFDPLPKDLAGLIAERNRLRGWVGTRAYLDTAILGRFGEIDWAIAALHEGSIRP